MNVVHKVYVQSRKWNVEIHTAISWQLFFLTSAPTTLAAIINGTEILTNIKCSKSMLSLQSTASVSTLLKILNLLNKLKLWINLVFAQIYIICTLGLLWVWYHNISYKNTNLVVEEAYFPLRPEVALEVEVWPLWAGMEGLASDLKPHPQIVQNMSHV